MLLELDGEGRAFWNFLDDLDFGDANFVPAGCAFLRANFAGNDNAGFLRETLQRLERLGIFLERANTLDNAGAVAKNREEQFARFPKVIEPALERDFLSVVLASLLDGDRGNLTRFIRNVHFEEVHSFSKRSMDLRAAASCSVALGASGPVFSFNSSTSGKLVCGADWRILMAEGQSMVPS